LRLRPNEAQTLDSRAFVWLRTGRLDKAIEDAGAALARDPKLASSLYVRGVAKCRLGDSTAGDADLAAARFIEPKVDNEFGRYGVRP
jgi:tetratricopeptide (TPR) repeat protein